MQPAKIQGVTRNEIMPSHCALKRIDDGPDAKHHDHREANNQRGNQKRREQASADDTCMHEEAQLEEGVELVHRSLAGLLERHGVQPISTDGKFDPHVHEALLSQPSEAEEGSVIDVVQKGYALGDRVVRPARVVIAAAPQEASDG